MHCHFSFPHSFTMASRAPWYAAYPTPRTAEPPYISRSELLHVLQTATLSKDVVLVDLRRTDHEVV